MTRRQLALVIVGITYIVCQVLVFVFFPAHSWVSRLVLLGWIALLFYFRREIFPTSRNDTAKGKGLD